MIISLEEERAKRQIRRAIVWTFIVFGYTMTVLGFIAWVLIAYWNTPP